MTAAERRRSIADWLDRELPALPGFERDEVLGHAATKRSLRRLAPERAAWLSAVAYARHVFTDYDRLLVEGWGVEAARHVTAPAIEDTLRRWGWRGEFHQTVV